MSIHYLEIVTPDVDSVCITYKEIQGLEFGEKDPNLGGARTARRTEGGLVGIRAPLHESEQPVIRPYFLVADIDAAVEAARNSGAEIALTPTELPGHGRCAILIQGGVQTGLWQV